MKIIIRANEFPVKYSNKNLIYSKDNTLNNIGLKQFVERLKSNISMIQPLNVSIELDNGDVISNGTILDFYKNFTNRDGDTFTHYENDSFPRDKVFTQYGLLINNIKYDNNDLSEERKSKLLKKIIDDINTIVLKKEFTPENSVIVPIPSTKKIPQCIGKEISKITNIPYQEIIKVDKKISSAKESDKDNYSEHFEYLKEKYEINLSLTKKNYIIIDDVFGRGYSMCYITNCIKKKIGISPYFFCICKDVKR